MQQTRSSSWWLFALAAVVAILLISLAIYNKRAPSPYDAFAQCLAAKEVTMYGTYWCPNCAKQKELFGNAFRYVPYKECSPQGQRSFVLCTSDNIEAVPTWEFANGNRLRGMQELSTLASTSGCALDGTSTESADTAKPTSDASTGIPEGLSIEVDEKASSGLQITDIGVQSLAE
jgi:hypothetical protein